MAVTCVHDFILAVLSERPELSYFHVNELLCKAFENMLCLEVCDGDVQDQVISERRLGRVVARVGGGVNKFRARLHQNGG